MSLVSKAEKIIDILGDIQGLKFYHLNKPATVKAPYAVWQEDSEGRSQYANNRKAEQVLEITIDYFTKEEFDSMADTIQDALNDAMVACYLNSIQYEDETMLTHYEWIVQVI